MKIGHLAARSSRVWDGTEKFAHWRCFGADIANSIGRLGLFLDLQILVVRWVKDVVTLRRR